MKYTLLIFEDEKNGWAQLSSPDQQTFFREYKEFTEDVKSSGKYVAGQRLKGTDSATTARQRNGKRVVTDGPFAETREQLGGFYVVEAADLNEAIELASRLPSARLGSVEIRPVLEATTREDG